MLRRLAWSSVPSTPLSPRHIDQIIGSSRLNNVRDHISGMLLFTGGHFLSIIEGDERDLCNLWIRLEQDGRHCKLFRIGDDPCGNRLYPAWVSGHVADPELDDQIASMRGVPNQPDTGRDRVAAEGKFASPLPRGSAASVEAVNAILLRGRGPEGSIGVRQHVHSLEGGRGSLPAEPAYVRRVAHSLAKSLTETCHACGNPLTAARRPQGT